MLNKLFPNYSEVTAAQKEMKEFKTRLEKKDAEIKGLYRRIDENIYSYNRDKEQTSQNHKHEVQERIKQKEKEVSDLKVELELAGKRADFKVGLAEEEAELKANAKVQKQIETLTSDLSTITAVESSSTARADAQQSIIDAQGKQLEAYFDFTKFIMTKLPDVKLDKFGITVDVPAPEVKFVGGGNHKK